MNLSKIWINLSYIFLDVSLKYRFPGCAQTLPNATPSIGKINPFSKMAVPFEPMKQFVYPLRLRMTCATKVYFIIGSTISNRLGPKNQRKSVTIQNYIKNTKKIQIIKKMLNVILLVFFNIRTKQFDQSSPVHPISESRGGVPWAWHSRSRSSSRNVLPLSNIGYLTNNTHTTLYIPIIQFFCILYCILYFFVLMLGLKGRGVVYLIVFIKSIFILVME